MGKLKLWAAAIAAMVTVGCSGSAMASTCHNIGDVCNVAVQVSGANGEYYYYGDYFAGLITFNVSGVGTIYVICDDKTDDVIIGSTYTYKVEDANAYLAPLGTTLIHEIAGLAFYALANVGNAVNAADAQEAIWDLMYGYTAQNSHITTIESQASYYYSLMVAQGWSYFELVSSTGKCDGKTDENMTYLDTPSCQNQGQIGLWNPQNPPISLPEPGSIGLMGLGLLVLGGLQLRRRTRKADLA